MGTHSLIQEGVAFNDLGLAIVDEQHRFGVMQRAGLSGKGGKGGGEPVVKAVQGLALSRTFWS